MVEKNSATPGTGTDPLPPVWTRGPIDIGR